MSIKSQRLLFSVLTMASLGFSSSLYLKVNPAIAIDISQNSEDKSKMIRLYKEGQAFSRSGKYEDATLKFEQALIVCRSIRDRAYEGIILINLGVVYRNLEQYQKAIDYYQKALVITQEIGSRADEGTILNNLGAIYKNTGEYQKAIEYFQRSLIISK